MGNKLFRSRYNSVISGVCGGLGKYFGTDPVIFRFAFVAMLLAGGSSIIIYLIFLIVIPKEPLTMETGSNATNAGSFDSFQQQDLSDSETDNSTKTIFGLLLISGGALMLLNNLVPLFNLKKLWPAILVIIGLGLLFQKSKPDDQSKAS